MKYYKTVYKNGKQIRLHRYIMECYIGRKLSSNELVHHKDGNIFNNNIDNLEIISRSDHLKQHKEIGKDTRFKTKYHFNKDKLIELYKTKTYAEIAELYDCAVMTVYIFFRRNKLKGRKRGDKKSNNN